MKINEGPQKLSELLKIPKQKKPPAYQWQDLALKIITELAVPRFKRNSVFRVCKENSQAVIERALNDTKELCKTGERWKYFFKVIADLDKKK